jgi:hypothetical protein
MVGEYMARARAYLVAVTVVLALASPVAAISVIAEPTFVGGAPVVASAPAEKRRGLSDTETLVMLLGSVVFSVVLLGRKLD